MRNIIFGITDATPMSAEADVGFHSSRSGRCRCGRFCRTSEEHGYDGMQNQIWITYDCSRCGIFTESVI